MIAVVMEPAGTIDPTEISNSPAIMSKPIGMAMIPRPAAMFIHAPILPTVRKLRPPKMVKKMNIDARPRNAPDSGLRKRPAQEKLAEADVAVFSKSGDTVMCLYLFPLFHHPGEPPGKAFHKVARLEMPRPGLRRDDGNFLDFPAHDVQGAGIFSHVSACASLHAHQSWVDV
jgi:hypothetical protein